MSPEFVIELLRNAMWVSLMVVAAPIGLAMVAGLMVSIFQAVTQISEMTLTFVPKILAVFAALVVFGPFMLDSLMRFTTEIFSRIPELVP